MNREIILLTLGLLLIFVGALAQDEQVDLGVSHFQAGVELQKNGKIDSAEIYYLRALPLLKESNRLIELGGLYHNLAGVSSDNDTALFYAKEYLRVAEELEDSGRIADAYMILGSKYDDLGWWEEAIESYLTAVHPLEQLGEIKMLIILYNNLSITYGNVDDQANRVTYLRKAINLLKRTDDPQRLGGAYNNFANALADVKKYDSALFYHQKAIEVRKKEVNNTYPIGESYFNVADVYMRMGNCEKARPIAEEAVDSLMKASPVVAKMYGGELLARVYSCLGRHSLADQRLQESLETAVQYNDLGMKKTILKTMSESYSRAGRHEEAYEARIQFEELEDSLFSIEKQRSINQMQARFEAEKRNLEIKNLTKEKEIQKKETARQKAEAEEQKAQNYLLIGGILFVLAVAAFITIGLIRTRRSRQEIRKQKDLVTEQKEVVEEKNKEILDSIEYAKRLQEAILPPRKLVAQYVPNSFILYKPKDIVAGDFYYMEPVDGALFYAAADCTGHGVPGAMVSVVCSNAMNKAIIEEGLRDPGMILNRVRELVIERFERSEEEVNDGMDISLVKLKLDKTGVAAKKGSPLQIEFAGANNPLWIIRKGGVEVEEIRGDRQPVGRFAIDDSFTTHKVDVNSGDSLYVFSDGYVDQFGGKRGKKFKSKNFQQALLKVKELPMDEQKAHLDNVFETWRGQIEQIDDVCVIGVRI